MHLIFHHKESNNRIKVEIKSKQSLKDIKLMIENALGIDTSHNRKLFFKYAGADLKEENNLQYIPDGSVIKCYVDQIKKIDFLVYVMFQQQVLELINTNFDPFYTLVIELRIFISDLIGIPLSVFRLKTPNSDDMYDEHRLSDYNVTRNYQFILETWHGWDFFLENCIKGFTKQVLDLLSKDELIRQYQLKVALFISAFYGNYDLANKTIKLGAKPDQPVGNHPCRMWCQNTFNIRFSNLKLKYHKCPIHVAAKKAQFNILLLMISDRDHIIEKKDEYGTHLWRLPLQNAQKSTKEELNTRKEIGRLILLKKAGLKFSPNKDYKVSLFIYSKLKYWLERAQEKCYKLYGIRKSSLKQRPFYKSSLLGPRVLIDGFNNDFKEVNKERPIHILPPIFDNKFFTNYTHSSYFGFSTDHFPDLTNKQKFSRNQFSIQKETMKLFERKYNLGQTVSQTARHYLDEANAFKSKSWLQQIELGSKMAENNVRRRLRNTP